MQELDRAFVEQFADCLQSHSPSVRFDLVVIRAIVCFRTFCCGLFTSDDMSNSAMAEPERRRIRTRLFSDQQTEPSVGGRYPLERS